jgi:hypothetical protein
MKIQTLYVIDPNNFEGQIFNTMSSSEGTPVYVDYMDKLTTLEEYKQIKGNSDLVALTWEDFEAGHYKPYLKSLCQPFQERTKEDFWEGLECLPPKRWTQDKDSNKEFFFVGECYTADLYRCFVRDGENYYSALRSISTSADDLLNRKDVQ